MGIKSGVDNNGHSMPNGGGGITSIGDNFSPNLAMGGGSYRLPVDLPSGPGGFGPKVELFYSTGLGNGPFGMGWSLSLPHIQADVPALQESKQPTYSLSGGERLVQRIDGSFVPYTQAQLQVFNKSGQHWTSRTSELIEMRFGQTPGSRDTGIVDGKEILYRWLTDQLIFPGNRKVNISYVEFDGLKYIESLIWGPYRLQFSYEMRPDPFTTYQMGFGLRTTRRCNLITLHNDSFSSHTQLRTYQLIYIQSEHTEHSLLSQVLLKGWRVEAGNLVSTDLPPLSFTYSATKIGTEDIKQFNSSTIPPPMLGDDVTIFDYHGLGLPGVLQMNGRGASYWENYGDFKWGPPQDLSRIPQGLHLRDDNVRFADLSGSLTADLIVEKDLGGGYYPNDPVDGFQPKKQLRLEPSFRIGEKGSFMVDLNDDRRADLLTFRNGVPMGFINEGGENWSGPIVLDSPDLPDMTNLIPEVQLADMNGDGKLDIVFLRSNGIQYFPNLGNGRWGPRIMMNNSPDFEGIDPNLQVFLKDIDGDGLADVVLIFDDHISLHFNQSGNGFSDGVTIERTPMLSNGRALLTDVNGDGLPGLLWNSDYDNSQPHAYWYLPLLGGVKPYLLTGIDNGKGLKSTIKYSTSHIERAASLAQDNKWKSYLPFPIHVVKEMHSQDDVSQEFSHNVYRYFNGHYDWRRREFLGFGEVESRESFSTSEAPVIQRYHFHNNAWFDAYIAGKGQPKKLELIDPGTGSIRRLDESSWITKRIKDTTDDDPAYLTLEEERRSERLEAGIVFESEKFNFEHNDHGFVTLEKRVAEWTNPDGILQQDSLILKKTYASHPTFGLTNILSQQEKIDGSGQLLKLMRFYYDGPDFIGLPLGQVEKGWLTRQTEVALTTAQINAAYGGSVPPEVLTHYTPEIHPDYNQIFVRPTRRYRYDTVGNQVETMDALGHKIKFAFDSQNMFPVSYKEGAMPTREMRMDARAMQITKMEDLNGHAVITEYDGLGNIIKVFNRDALPGKPTEEYEFDWNIIPNRTTKKLRFKGDETVAGHVEHKFISGSGKPVQIKVLAEDGRWAVRKQKLYSLKDRQISERDSFFTNNSNFELTIPSGVLSRELKYDFAGRLISEDLFNGSTTTYEYKKNAVHFFDPKASALKLIDQTTPASRISLSSAWGNVVSSGEWNGSAYATQSRSYDALGQLKSIRDGLGHLSVENVYDLWGHIIHSLSAEKGEFLNVRNAKGGIMRQVDADGRELFYEYDFKGRLLKIRRDRIDGPIEETYTYDVGSGLNIQGRLAHVNGAFGSAEYSYSKQGDPSSILRTYAEAPGQSFRVAFSYDHQRQVTTVEYPDATKVDYNYYQNGLLRSITGFIDNIEYNDEGLRSKIEYTNGLETERKYSAGHHLLSELKTQVAGGGGGNIYQHLVYHLDSVGQVSSIDDLANVTGKIRNNQTFGYDIQNRLTQATGRGPSGMYSFNYEYDAAGNCERMDESFSDRLLYGHHLGDVLHPNRLIKKQSSVTNEYDYDLSGNMTQDIDIGTFEYDYRHRMTATVKNDGTRIEMQYDHQNRRTSVNVIPTAGPTETKLEVEGLFVVQSTGNAKIIMDQDRKLAYAPDLGDTIIFHPDRLGNTNIFTNLATGAFVGQHEYTPYGNLSVAIRISPAANFQGGNMTSDTGLVLLGERYYNPRLGRFISGDRFLLSNQQKIPLILAGSNLYLYGLCNPINFTDPTGQIAFLAVIGIAAIVGAVLGAIGAAANGAQTWDEWLLWIVGGAIGGALIALTGGGIAALFGASAATGAIVATTIWGVASLLSSLLTPILDDSNSVGAWVVSFIIKFINSPLTSIAGLIAWAVVAAQGGNWDFRRGTLFIDIGPGGGALTLGGVVWTQGGRFDAAGNIPDDLARHEAYHTRTVGALGELGFYFTYVTVGAIWGSAEGGGWNDLNGMGCGNPFEKTAHTFTMDPATAVATHNC